MQRRKRGFITCKILKGETWRVSPRCRRCETHEELWIRNLLSRETKFAPYETNSNLYRERFAEQTKLPTIYIYIPTYIRRGVVDRECPSQVFSWFSFQFFKLPRDHTFGFYSLNRCSDNFFEYKCLNMLFINFIQKKRMFSFLRNMNYL